MIDLLNNMDFYESYKTIEKLEEGIISNTIGKIGNAITGAKNKIGGAVQNTVSSVQGAVQGVKDQNAATQKANQQQADETKIIQQVMNGPQGKAIKDAIDAASKAYQSKEAANDKQKSQEMTNAANGIENNKKQPEAKNEEKPQQETPQEEQPSTETPSQENPEGQPTTEAPLPEEEQPSTTNVPPKQEQTPEEAAGTDFKGQGITDNKVNTNSYYAGRTQKLNELSYQQQWIHQILREEAGKTQLKWFQNLQKNPTAKGFEDLLKKFPQGPVNEALKNAQKLFNNAIKSTKGKNTKAANQNNKQETPATPAAPAPAATADTTQQPGTENTDTNNTTTENTDAEVQDDTSKQETGDKKQDNTAAKEQGSAFNTIQQIGSPTVSEAMRGISQFAVAGDVKYVNKQKGETAKKVADAILNDPSIKRNEKLFESILNKSF
jgi:hypothetical protein